MAEIYQTQNYGLFHFDEANRTIVPKHVAKLAEQVKTNNLLHLFPIVVVADQGGYLVRDGQHRLLAAEQLGVPIFYVVDNTQRMDRKAVPVINTSSKRWGMADYLNFYCAQGNKEYIALKNLWMEYPRASLWSLCQVSGTSGLRPGFHEGRFQFIYGDVARQVLRAVTEIFNATGFNWVFTRFTIIALAKCVRHPQVKMDYLVSKIVENRSMFYKCPDIASTLSMLEAVYNYRLQYRVRLTD